MLAVVLPIVVIVPMSALLFFALSFPHSDMGPWRVIAFVVPPVAIVNILFMAALLVLGPSRMRYLVGDGALEVRTLFGKRRWATAGARAKVYTPVKLWRVMGTGAPGYLSGSFRESGLRTRVYATETDRVVLFEGTERVILSPEDRVEMLRALEAEGVAIERDAL